MICPQCYGSDMRSIIWEDRDDETGYHVEEYRWTCAACGEVSTEDEMEHANAEGAAE